MYLSESHIIKPNHSFWNECDSLCFLSKNLYNKANYIIRQKFIETSKLKESGLTEFATYLNYYDINRLLIDSKDFDFYNLPCKVSNQTLMLLDQNWKSFFKSIKDWSKNKHKYKGKPKFPKYLGKKDGRFVAGYELGAISKVFLDKGIIKLSKTNIEIPFINKEKGQLKMVRIVPMKNNIYKIEVIYDREIKNLNLDKSNILSGDLGINNLLTLTSNKKGFNPLIINGRNVKSINQYYNKKKAKLQSELPFSKNKDKEGNKVQIPYSKRLAKLTHKRNMKINNEFHNISKFIIDLCIKHNIGTIVIGKNKDWKDEVNLGNKNNQNFVSIPHNKLIEQIRYKGELVGIDLLVIEESYTSKASFFDLDELPVYEKDIKNEIEFSGKRVKRGLYKRSNGELVNSDVNGSYNIMRKVILRLGESDFTHDQIEGFAVIPIRVKSNRDIL